MIFKTKDLEEDYESKERQLFQQIHINNNNDYDITFMLMCEFLTCCILDFFFFFSANQQLGSLDAGLDKITRKKN